MAYSFCILCIIYSSLVPRKNFFSRKMAILPPPIDVPWTTEYSILCSWRPIHLKNCLSKLQSLLPRLSKMYAGRTSIFCYHGFMWVWRNASFFYRDNSTRYGTKTERARKVWREGTARGSTRARSSLRGDSITDGWSNPDFVKEILVRAISHFNE